MVNPGDVAGNREEEKESLKVLHWLSASGTQVWAVLLCYRDQTERTHIKNLNMPEKYPNEMCKDWKLSRVHVWYAAIWAHAGKLALLGMSLTESVSL